jgi:2-dehydropantoate 2-reductase
MRIAMIGAGPVGGYFGGLLAHGGADVTIIERGATLKAICEQGLRIDDVNGDFEVHPRATDDPKSVGFVDAVLLAVQGWQVPGAIETVRPLMGPSTTVIPLMDGIEAPDQLAQAFGHDRVVGELAVMYGWLSPEDTFAIRCRIGEFAGRRNGRVAQLRNAFERAGLTTKIAPDIECSLWQKLVMVGPWSGVGAVTRAPLGVIRSIPETREFLERACARSLPSLRLMVWRCRMIA